MPFLLTDEVFENLWGEAELKGEASLFDTDVEEVERAILPHVGQFCNQLIPLQAGLNLRILEYEVAEDLLQGGDAVEDRGAGLIFCLSGKVQTTHRGLTQSIEREEPIGYCFLENLSGVQETELWAAGKPFLRVYLCLDDPLKFFSDFDSKQLAQLPVELERTSEGHYQPYYRTQPMTAAMCQVLRQILHCPYEGLLKRLYLQGKALELMTLQFEQFQFGQTLNPGSLKPSEIERIHHAKDILLQHLDNPLSLIELARQAGLNDFALKQGFQQVFGTTVFQYLHHHRLEIARQLLKTDDLQVSEVAKRVGFGNRGHFAAAFRKKFGFSPKAYQLQQKNSVKGSKNSVS